MSKSSTSFCLSTTICNRLKNHTGVRGRSQYLEEGAILFKELVFDNNKFKQMTKYIKRNNGNRIIGVTKTEEFTNVLDEMVELGFCFSRSESVRFIENFLWLMEVLN